MKLRKLYKGLISTIFIFGALILGVYLVYKFLILGGGLSPGATQLESEQNFDKNQIQYRFSYTGDKNVNQIVYLNKGNTIFKLEYSGNGNFVVQLMKTTGEVVSELASEKGNYKKTKSIIIPDDDTYILSVNADGKWDIAYN